MAQLSLGIDREQVKKVLQRYKFYFILGGIVFVLLAGMLFLKLNYAPAEGEEGYDPVNINAGTKGDSAEQGFFLPQTSRNAGDIADMRDPFAFMALKGVITGGNGENLAVIEAGNNAYVVQAGAEVAGTWTVKEIGSSSVVLKTDEQEMTLGFGGRVKTTDIKENSDNTGDESEASSNEND